MTQGRWIWMAEILLLATTGVAAFAEERQPAQTQSAGEVVTGTLIKLDLTSMKGLIETDLGKPVFFEVTKPNLFEHLSVGERVTIELDPYGQANKVMGSTVPEFLPPLFEEPGDSRSSVG